jgi:glycosyltransferase involved in cell wall biosynthesis
MRILMIAPQPFFEPRGTPFSEYHRIRALTDLGHTVDLVTYPFGETVSIPGLRLHRSWRPPGIHHVGIGPSWAKVPLDIAVALKAAHVAAKWRFDLVHSHEEGGAIGVVLARLLRVPHLYDMHSSLPEQLSNFRFSRSRVLLAAFRWLERRMIKGSGAVIVICRYLEDLVRQIDPGARVVLIENAPGAGDGRPTAGPNPVRASAGIAPDAPLVVYTGTFEAYQGLDLLFAAMSRVHARLPGASLLMAGGRGAQLEQARRDAAAAGLDGRVVFIGERPSAEIPDILDAADVLVSPRSRGKNTPLKIYQYLRSGRAIVATNLLTHTQVLNDSVAVLTDPTPDAYADGILRTLLDRQMAADVSGAALRMANEKYTYEAYLDRTREVLAHVDRTRAGEVRS